MDELSLRARVLGGILKRIGGLKLDSFTNRLSLQKRVYLLQAFGVHLGYQFSWYLYGPYSPGLTQDAYEIEPLYDQLPEYNFDDALYEERLKLFEDFLKGKKNDTKWLEVLASIHFLRKIFPWQTKKDIIDHVEKKQPYFDQQICELAWQKMRAVGLI